MHVLRPRTDLSRFLLSLTPLLGAVLIAISRCEDYRHDAYDVTAGSILGICIATFSYRRYYPRLRSPRCDEPFPSRADIFVKNLARHMDDEEARVAIESEDLDDEQTPLREMPGNSG